MDQQETKLCVVLDPPEELVEKANEYGKDAVVIWDRVSRPRRLFARLPIQLLAGQEIVDDTALMNDLINDTINNHLPGGHVEISETAPAGE